MTVKIDGNAGYIADFSNATLTSRQSFQTSTSNSTTGIYALPNGTSTAASWQATNNSDPTNASKILIATNGSTDVQLVSGRNGTGTYLPLTFYTNGSEQARLDVSGNLGLGVTPSAWAGGYKSYDVQGASFASSGPAGILILGNNAYNNGTNWIYKANGYATDYVQINSEHRWRIAASGTAGGTVSYTQAMTLDASGNLGIGTSSPGQKLDVSGTARATTVQILNNGSSGSAATTPELYSPASATLAFGAGGAERMRIDSSGNLLLASTSALSFSIPTIQGGGSNGDTLFTNRRNTTASASHFRIYNPNGLVGDISSSGSTTTYATSSDYRLKENVQPMVGALSKVAALKPVTYKWKVDGSDGEGFIAHELAEVVPQCVTGEKDAVDADGNPVYQGIDTSFLVATLTAAIQEQQAIITTLTARIEALEAKNA